VLPVERANTQPTPEQAVDCAAFPPLAKAAATLGGAVIFGDAPCLSLVILRTKRNSAAG
jgi:hypothetical protein